MSAPPANAGALVGTRLGDYELVALLALGGTAEIYLARVGGHAGFEKYVVVKCLHDHLAYDPEFVQMFLDEARLGAQLDHSNIVQTLGLGEQDGRYYLVMEYVAGMSLALIARRAAERVAGSRIPPPLVLGLATQAAAGLHYAHERRAGAGQPPGSLNLVHRDISPQNLVVTFEGVVKIVDFGIAKAEERSTATRSGTIKGKFAYMSPEQCVAKHVDRRTDVFALGVVVHELLTGRRLFKRASTYETYQAILECKVPPPSAVNHELDPAIDAVVMPALAKDPGRRYPTAEAFGEAISAYLHRGGRHAGAGAISTFIEQFFQPEIADHGDRMRELLEGRGGAAGGWDDDDEAEEISGDEVLDSDDGGLAASSGPTGFEEGPGTDQEGAAADGSTRIEMNPLARLAELNEEVRRSAAFPVPEMPTTIAVNGVGGAGRAALPVPPAVAPPPAAPSVQVSPALAAEAAARPTPAPAPAAPAPAPAPAAQAAPAARPSAVQPAAVPAPARNPGPPRPLFAAATPGGSIFGGKAGAAGPSAGSATPRPAPPPSAAVKPLEIASLFGASPAPARRAEASAAPAASPAANRPTALAPAVNPAAPLPARAPGFGPSNIPTVLAEPEPTPARPDTPASTVPTMSLELHDVINDLGGARPASMDPSGGPLAAHHGAAYGTPPGTPMPDSGGYTPLDSGGYQVVDSGGYPAMDSGGYPPAGEQVLLPAHLIGLPPVEQVPLWDGTFQHPRRGVSPVVLTMLLLAGIALATVLVILIARAA